MFKNIGEISGVIDVMVVHNELNLLEQILVKVALRISEVNSPIRDKIINFFSARG